MRCLLRSTLVVVIFFSCCNSHVFDARSPHRQEELELGWELLLAVEAIAEVDAADA